MTPPAGGRKSAPLVEVIIASPQWRKKPQAAALIRKAIRAACKSVSTPQAELAILLTNDSAIRVLNHQWRKIDAPTNVLSFPAKKSRAKSARNGRGAAKHLGNAHMGDIIIAYETLAREAAAEDKKFEHHLVHLAVHGFLHLLDYDHATDRDAKKMERLEIDILAQLGVPDPYVARDPAK
jgi:probable rRNA maturation factor